MEYIFGTTKRHGIDYDGLKTISSSHTNLTGEVSVERIFPDSIITDTFIVVEKYMSKEDSEDNCYDWYIIKDHYRYIDKYSPAANRIDDDISEIQNAICEQSTLLESALADVENALCELSEQINS